MTNASSIIDDNRAVAVLDDSLELLEALIRLPEAEQDRERRIVRACSGSSGIVSSRRFTI
jgi:hypothetical protein